MCFVDGGVEGSLISRALYEALELSATPYETTMIGVGGLTTAVMGERDVPLHLGRKERAVKALVWNNIPTGDIILAADWLYKHTIATTHRPPAIWFGEDKTTIHGIIETTQGVNVVLSRPRLPTTVRWGSSANLPPFPLQGVVMATNSASLQSRNPRQRLP